MKNLGIVKVTYTIDGEKEFIIFAIEEAVKTFEQLGKLRAEIIDLEVF